MTIIEKEYKWTGSLEKRSATRRIILHHAAAVKCSADDVHAWHLGNGWSGIGYHFLVRKDGSVFRGRPVDTVGAHTYGKNSDSIGICFEGNFENETMGQVQKQSGIELVSYLLVAFPTITQVCRHKDFNATACPGKNFPFDDISSAKRAEQTVDGTSGGAMLSLYKEPLYASASSIKASGTVTGNYYLWGGAVVNGRVRITNTTARIGTLGQVTGWIKAPENTAVTTHLVVKGDTLVALAAHYGTTVNKILTANKSKYPAMTANYIVIGWKLAIPA